MDFINKNINKQSSKIKQEKSKEDEIKINQLIYNWKNTFGNLEKWNKEYNGYTLSNIKVETYGFSSRVYAPWGMNLFALSNYTDIIETGCKCEFLYEIPQHRQFALAKFIYPEQIKINSWDFTPVKVKPYEFCPGYDITGKPIVFNLNNSPHILVAGQQRRGKNASVDNAIVSWIYSCTHREIMFYMFQCAKNDLVKYKECSQVYCYASTLGEILIALKHLEKELFRRTKLFESMVKKADGNDNIFHYNKLHPYNKLPYIIVIIDEFIELMPDNSTDDKDIKIIKNEILKRLQMIGQWGGSLGINYCPLHQKPSAKLMPPFIKNQSSIRICFGFEDLVCCAIVLGDELAKHAYKLPPRKAYFSNNEQNGYLYTPNLKGRIRMFIKDSIKPNHRNLFSDLEKLKSSNKKLQINKTSLSKNIQNKEDYLHKDKGVAPIPKNINKNYTKELNFDKVDPFKSTFDNKKLINNIKNNIPNFVPYNAKTNPEIIIDKTKFDPSKTKKPIKNK
ncbi:FtsK/SpoIIIE domain-containing protein [Clostridium rectalis]|uniref:FtsK/SpoIIIE domain-containing protein n=1 Tax=Clostridium rectalis TaxID=2040295 RepID=UPI000F63EE2B|nr:FtsK/SpoIIIE domain-containing protein [Clostridium rectalis]